MRYTLIIAVAAMLAAACLAPSNYAGAVTNPCTPTNPCNYQVCGSHLCSQGEFDNYMRAMLAAQRGNATSQPAAQVNMTSSQASTLYVGTQSYEDAAPDGTLVIVSTNHPMQGKPSVFGIGFFSANGSPIRDQNYAITIKQGNVTDFAYQQGHASSGFNVLVTGPMASSDDPISLAVTLKGVGPSGADPSTWTGLKDYTLAFAQGPINNKVHLVPGPEFGQTAPIMLALAVLGTVALASRTRFVPRT